MRNLFLLLLVSAFGLTLLASSSSAQKTDAKKPEDPEKVLAGLLKAVKDKDNIDGRINAMVALQDFGPKAEPALPDLLEALETKNEDLRLNAAITLGKIGKAAVKPVAELLTSKDEDTVFYALWTIGWIGPDAKETVPMMIKLAASKNEGVRRKAIFALGRLAGDADKTIDVLVGAFTDESDEVRQAAGDALAKFGKDAVKPLIGLLKSDNPKARMQASISLGEIGSEAKEAVPLLKDLYLAKTDANPQHYAQILAKFGKAGVPALEAGFKDSRPEVRQAASQALQQVGAEAVPVLVDALGDKNVEVRRMAAQTLWPMRIGDKSVVIALSFALADEDDQVKQWSMNALLQLQNQAKLAAPKLKEALSDMNPNIRQQAFSLLQTLGENPGPTLIKALSSKNEKVRINTACLMVQMGVESEAATPVLVEALEHKDLGLKMQAAFTLAQRQLEKDKVLPIFLDGLKHKAAGVRVQAVQGLGMFRNVPETVSPKIAEALADSDQNVRQQAVYALQGVPGKAETIVPILTKIYKGGDASVRTSILQLSWAYKGKMKDIITEASKDKNIGVRQQAAFALQNTQGDLADMAPLLMTFAKDKELQQHVRQNVVWNFHRFGEAGLPHLTELLKTGDTGVRQTTLQVMQNLGPKVTAKAMPAIKDACKDADENVRWQAMVIVASTGGEGGEFLAKQFKDEKSAQVRTNLVYHMSQQPGHRPHMLPLLKDVMKDSSPQVRQACVQVLGNFGNDSKEGFEVFLTALKDGDNNVRLSAANLGNFYGKKCWDPLEGSLKSTKDAGFRHAILNSLHNSGYRSKTGIVPLIDCLKDGNQNVRQMACHVLGNIGPDAADALPMLKKIADDGSNQFVQQAARNAVQRIAVKDKDK